MNAVERAAREACGRLTALLARRAGGDLLLAEDAVQDALVAALERWPEQGVPDDPLAWLYTVAKRGLVGQWRKSEVRARKASALRVFQQLQAEERQTERSGWPDERVPLLFAAAHPAIEPSIRAPLMLQAVLGLTAQEVAARMHLAPKTMGQRLWRAKRKIRESKIPFHVPAPEHLSERLGSVLDAIYGLYGSGWQTPGGDAARAREAQWLIEVVLCELPDEPEARALHALILYAEGRRRARRTDDGAYVPLPHQDVSRWESRMHDLADAQLRAASLAGRIGPFQLEAAIQSALVHGHRQGHVDHPALLTLYDGLVELAPTLGAQVGRAVVVAEVRGPRDGLNALPNAPSYQPAWAVRAELLYRLGENESSRNAYDTAIDLCTDPAVKTWLIGRQARLG